MIKRFRFGPSPFLPPCPTSIEPMRVTLSLPLETSDGSGFTVQWFADRDALANYENWVRDEQDAAPVVLAEEVVQRGNDWLERRWAEGGRKWKHVALARRAPGLSCAEFSLRWRNHAGRATTRNAGVSAIPEAARGLAYVQNHPIPRSAGEWPFDAITEVWFDDPRSMENRVHWFRDNIARDELFGEPTFLALTEELVAP